MQESLLTLDCETERSGAEAARAIITRKQKKKPKKKQDLEEPRRLQHFAICLDRNFSVSAKKQKNKKKQTKMLYRNKQDK